MNYLADTHVLLWSFFEPERLSKTVRGILLDESNDIYYSPISLWEISIKHGLNKLHLDGMTPEEFYAVLDESYFLCSPVEPLTAITNFRLPRYHKDPFDRFLIWEAIKNDYVLLSADNTMAEYAKEGLKVAC
jgi:PIN domain nuclease of toxin-antitoxin system